MINQGIYKITNLINNQCYIGKTNNFERRKKDHLRLAFTEGHKEYNKTLYRAIRKYGQENFSFDIIERLEDYSLSGEREKYWIRYYDSYKNGYNESEGGDGGSIKGHCRGSKNGRAILTEQDIVLIRTKYKEGCSRQECYKIFKDKISFRGFCAAWNGKTWQHIMPEVYSQENIKRNASLGRSHQKNRKRLLTNDEVKSLRQWRTEGIPYSEIIKKLNNKISLSTAKDIGNYRTYKEVK